jgi:hypothetical protein
MIQSTALKVTRFLPIIGILTYVVLYFLAADMYPGGSRVYPDTIGFDWTNNYWCHLMADNSINGVPNPSKSYAVAGLVILCFSLGFFFFQFPHYFKLKSPWSSIVPISGIASAFFTLFITSAYHDLTGVLAAIFGALSIVGIFFGLRRSGLIHFIWTGIICVILIALNGYIYFSENFIIWLPVIQKVTFAAVLLWMVCLNSMFGNGKSLVPMKRSFNTFRRSFGWR